MNHTARRLLVLAAAVGLITGLIALSGHTLAVAAHTFGGIAALTFVGIAARYAWSHKIKALIGAMIVANVTGIAWTAYGATAVVVVAHIITGVAASAGAVILASEQLTGSPPDTDS